MVKHVPKVHHEPILPVVMACLVVVSLVWILASALYSEQLKTGYAIAQTATEDAVCISQGRQGAFYAVSSQESCCYLIENAKECREAFDGEYAYYKNREGEYQDIFRYKYICGTRSGRGVAFSDDVKVMCGLDI